MASDSNPGPRFFVLQSQRGTRYDTEFDKKEPVFRGEAPRCPKCGGPVGMLTWLPPHRVTLEQHGEELGDFVQSLGGSSDLLVTERFADAFQAEGLAGLSGFHPVEVLRVRRQRRGPRAAGESRYLAVTASFGSALVDEARSLILRPGPFDCDDCRAIGADAVHGFTLEQASWNGDDVFKPRGLVGTLVVSERFARFVEAHRLTNMLLTPTEQYVRDPLGRFPRATGRTLT